MNKSYIELLQTHKATGDFVNMIFNSGTGKRLTENERALFIDILAKYSGDHETASKEMAIIKGTYEQRGKVCSALYSTFLDGLGYKPIGGRGE